MARDPGPGAGILAGDYYAACQQVFRQATDQGEVMLDALLVRCAGREELRILSVGAGTGLFELPMLERLRQAGVRVRAFAGIDPDEYACRTLVRNLEDRFGDDLEYSVETTAFEEYASDERFDLVIFNHVLEYMPSRHLDMVRKALGLLAESGQLMIFSPLEGGINRIYAEEMQVRRGWPPFFAAQLEAELRAAAIPYETKQLMAYCSTAALSKESSSAEQVMLLSFLSQVDCRSLAPAQLADYRRQFRSLEVAGRAAIPHPTGLFVLRNPA